MKDEFSDIGLFSAGKRVRAKKGHLVNEGDTW